MMVAFYVLMHLIPVHVMTIQLATPDEGVVTLTRVDGVTWKSSGHGAAYDNTSLKVSGEEITITVNGKREDGFTGGSFGPGPEWGFKPDTKWERLNVLKLPEDKAANLEEETITITRGTNGVTVAYKDGKNSFGEFVATWNATK